jgi:excisionase family DNA binding protein
MTSPLLTARAVAETLDVSSETVLRWTRRGQLPAVRLPSGQIRYRPDELAAWLAAREVVAEPPVNDERPAVTPGARETSAWQAPTHGP